MKDYRILVLQRGWVVIGQYSESGDECRLDFAAVIRRWGTTKGIGELCGGPTSSTILDRCGTVRAAKLVVVMSLAVDAKKWSGVLC